MASRSAAAGNGFPGLAIVSSIALLAALALALLVALHPWSATTVAPRVGLAPGIGVGLGEASPVPSGEALAISPARPAEGGGNGAFVSTAAAATEPRPLVAGLGQARAVSRTGPSPGAETPAEAPGQVAPETVVEPEAPAPEPVMTPVAAPAPQPAVAPKSPSVAGGSPEPSAAGAGEPLEGEEAPAPEEGLPEEGATEEEPVEEEEPAAGEEGECTPPFALAYEGAEHEVALCFETVAGETRLYLLLDGALIEIDVP